MANQARIVALGGVTAALSLIFLFLGSVVPIAQMIMPAIAGLLLIVIVGEVSSIKWAWVIFAAVSILAALLCPDKGVVIYYIFFFGHYPLLKRSIERFQNRVCQWVLKFLLFNACLTAAYFITVQLFGLPNGVVKYGYLLILVLLNIAFVLYDIAVTRLITVYFLRFRRHLHRR
ncbi:MAG TPA: hypothetical protein DEP42_00140 [Ruminococcaceae bacterium]|nr:hypothetical protein [Oscillospiraceae bacterium]